MRIQKSSGAMVGVSSYNGLNKLINTKKVIKLIDAIVLKQPLVIAEPLKTLIKKISLDIERKIPIIIDIKEAEDDLDIIQSTLLAIKDAGGSALTFNGLIGYNIINDLLKLSKETSIIVILDFSIPSIYSYMYPKLIHDLLNKTKHCEIYFKIADINIIKDCKARFDNTLTILSTIENENDMGKYLSEGSDFEIFEEILLKNENEPKIIEMYKTME